MKQNSYEMIIWWSAADNAYLVDVPELPGCMAHGLTRQQAIKNAEEVNTGKAELTALGVRAVDTRTLEITLKAPTAYFLQLLTHTTGLPVHEKSVVYSQYTFAKNESVRTPYRTAHFQVRATSGAASASAGKR